MNPFRDPQGAPENVVNRRAWWLVLLTLVVPGSAQVVAGNRGLGRLGLKIMIGLLAAGSILLILFMTSRSTVIGLFTNSWFLIPAGIVLIGLAVLWAVLFLDAWRLSRPSTLVTPTKVGVSLLTMALVLVTSGTLVQAARVMFAQKTLVGSIFAKGDSLPAVDGRYNLLLIGGDAGEDRTGLRNDTNILMSVDAKSGRVVQIGIPRNLANAPFAEGSPMAQKFPNGFNGKDPKFNAIYTYASEHKGLYPNQEEAGYRAVMDGASGVTGLKIQFYVVVDLAGFENLVDAVGGLDMDVRKKVARAAEFEKRADSFIEVGKQHFDGEEALWFARSRWKTTDYERMARQKCLIDAMRHQLNPQNVLTRFQSIAQASRGMVKTNIPQSQLGSLADLVGKGKNAGVTSVQLVPPQINTTHPDFTKTRTMVSEGIKRSKQEKATGLGSVLRDGVNAGALVPPIVAEPVEPDPTDAGDVDPHAICQG